MPTLKIDSARLNRTLEELGRFGDTPEGMQRIAFSPADIAGREYAISLMHGAGLETRIDTAGNIIGRRAGSVPGLPAIALGSHTDTVPGGGKYDGALGVMAAIEVVQTLADNGVTLHHPVETLVFTNEEGTRFHRWLIGSRSMAGLLEPEDLIAVDDEGVHLSVRMADIGGDLSRIGEAARKPGDLAAYFELHIEQGLTLLQSKIPIGVVTAITGRAVFEVEIKGMANHAGTTLMPARRDALVSAARLILAVQRLASELQACRVATVGSIQVIPNAVNVIPGNVRLGLEFRDTSMEAFTAAEAELRRAAREISDSDGVEMEIECHRASQPVPIKPPVQALVEEAANRCGLTHTRLPSGAGHDAQAMAAITDSAMIFVPSQGGISHAPAEFSTPEDCANGAQTLLELLLLADERL
ncbi:MAG: Zn-dependent hydrolase [Dehalococcoidia bacterium]|jgi:N-carbamoyl-L-amino-acid hydrolase|nr:Zn-dependent hydrolase [Dehalococcoidia bacterium]MDP6227373.1 Zn-dependent hydrolase [Dehalococcoidia bacterium]MDP7082992.1 Zn-dependent hydrolase [Dehalococcoidia bacterium]MDP7200408.1 Zn-dependent hydrolase [Dehalococcoidia bacterium]MDP7511851.1 Zn-dependent hydrolase [Dehalococcoidia bacterium]